MSEGQRPRAVHTLDELRGVNTGNVCDAQGRRGHLAAAILPLYAGARVLGPAFTVLSAPGDNLAVHRAIELAAAGDVLVVAMGGHTAAGFFGEIMATASRARGLAGLVTDGACRDSDEFSELAFPVFAAGRSPGGTLKEDPGYVNVPVICGGVLVRPGDLVFGDADGVVAIQAVRVDEVLAKARAGVEREATVRRLLEEGQTTMDIYGFRQIQGPDTREEG